MTTITRILRSGIVAVAEAHRPTSQRGAFVHDKLATVARQVKQGFEQLLADGFVSERALHQAAADHVAKVSRTFSHVRVETDRLKLEAEQAQDAMAAAVGRLEANVSHVAVRRLERIGQRLRGMTDGELRRELDRATHTRDADTLLAAAMEGLRGGREFLENFAVGKEQAEHARQLQREAHTLHQATQLLAIGLEQMTTRPQDWIQTSTQARPEERLSVCEAGPAAFIEVRDAARSLEARYRDGLAEQATLNAQATATTAPVAEVADG